MVNPAVAGVGKTVSKGFVGIFGFLFKIKWRYIFIVALFIQALIIAYQSGGGLLELLKILGERFFGIIKGLAETSQIVVDSGGEFKSIFSFIGIVWNLFSNCYLVYLWLRLFDYLFGKSPFSNESAGFINFSFALIFFYLAQIFYLLIIKYPLAYPSMDSYTFWEIFKLPISSFKLFFDAIVIIFTSTSFNKIIDIGMSDVINDTCVEGICTI